MKMNPFQNIERFDLRVLAFKVNYSIKMNIIHTSLCMMLGLLFLFSPDNLYGQACDSVPSFTVDLTGQPNGTWFSTYVKRDGNCCGSSWPDRCIEFWVTLDPNAGGLNFYVSDGAMPSGALFYQIGCGPMYEVGVPICLPGPGPYHITFCKPGSNLNQYAIASIGKPTISGDVIVSDGCSSTITTSNFILSTITWNSIFPSPANPGKFNSYLSFPHNKDTAIATYAPGAPSSVTYQVCGTPIGGCSTQVVCKTATVKFVSTLGVVINPNNPTICYGGSSTPLTANVTGGSGPYTYTWTRNGANVGNTQVINASTTGTYVVTVKDATSCPTATNSVVVTAFTSPITANAGPDQTSCANNPTAVLSGAIQQATGGIWSGGAGTYSPSKTSLTVTYSPTAAEIIAGSVTHTLTTTGNGTCPASTDQMVLTIAKTPIVSAGPNQTVCANNSKVTLAGSVTYAGGGRWSGGAGTYIPNDSTLDAIYTPTDAEITAGVVNLKLTSIQNGSCLPVSSIMQITITPAPTVNANIDQTVCANNPNVTLNGLVIVVASGTWSGGAGTFTLNANTLNAVYTPTATEISAGTVTLTLTANKATCIPVTDQMVITITPAPSVDAGADQTVCANNTINLAGSETIATGGTWSGGTGIFSPNANTLDATYTPSPTEISNGTVTLTLTSTGNGKCIAVSDQMTITLTPAPVVNAGPDQTVCGNNEVTSLAGSVTIATGGIWSGGAGTFSPNKTSLDASYTPTTAEIAAGSVTLTLTSTGNGTCLTVTDQMIITITPAPTANAGPDLSICENNAVAQLAGAVTVASGGIWSGGSGTFIPNNTTLNAQYVPTAAEIANGIIHLTLTTTGYGNCNPVSDNIAINITPPPTVDAGSDQTVCGNNSSVALNGNVTISSGGLWTTSGTGTFSPNATTLNASYQASPADIASASVTLTLTTTGNGNCIAVSDQMIISFSSVPLADAGPDTTACTNDFPIHLAGNGTAGAWVGGTGTFLPSRTVLNPTYTPSASEIAAGTISLTYQTYAIGSCPSISDDVTIAIPPGPVVSSGTDMTICANKTPIPLSGSVNNASGGIWTSNGTGTFTPSATALNASYVPSVADTTNGIVTLKLTSTGNGGCTAEYEQIVITFTHAPIVYAGLEQTYCADVTSIPLSGSKTLAGGVVWSGGAGTFSPGSTSLNTTYIPTASEKNSGSLTLFITTTGNGTCNAERDSVVITFTPAPTVNAGTDQIICADTNGVSLNGSVTVATGGMWTSSGSGYFTPNEFALNATYVPSAADTLAHSIQLTLTTTGNGTCIPVTDIMNIHITPIPVVIAGTDKTYCSDIVSAPLSGSVVHAGGGQWTTTGTGSFTPSNSASNASYVPSPADKLNGSVILTISSTGMGTCNKVTDQVILNFTPAPTIYAGADDTICETASLASLSAAVTIATGGHWTTSGTGTFSDPNSLNPTYFPSKADSKSPSVILTITSTGNGTCNPVSDNMVLYFAPKPNANAGTNLTVCGDVASISLNGSVANATGGIWSGGSGTFSPSATNLNAAYIPTAAESAGSSVKLILTTTGNGSCFPKTDQVILTITPKPTTDAGVSQIVCADIGKIAISGSVTVATGGQWTSSGSGTFANANSLNTSYTPSAADISKGTVVLTLTTTGNGTCIPVSDQITITITPAPTINAGPDQSICASQVSVLLSGSVTVATGALWTTSGSGTFLPNNTTLSATYYPSAADTTLGLVTLTLTSTGNGTCIPVSDNMVINILRRPIAYAGPDKTYCSDIVSAPLSGSVTHATGGQWSTSGTGTFSPNNTTLNAAYIPSAADKSGGVVALTLLSTGNGVCNAEIDFVELTFTPAPTINAGSDTTTCASTPPIPLHASVTVASGGTWTTSGSGTFSDPNSLNPTYTPSGADTLGHSVTLTITSTGNGTCIPVKDNKVITLIPSPVVDAGPGQSLCASVKTATLNGSVFNATGGKWTTSGTGTFGNTNSLSTIYIPSTADTAAGSVKLILTSTGNGLCAAVSDTTTIGFNDLPSISAGFDTLCTNLTGVNLNASVKLASGGKWTTSGTGTFSPSANSLTTKYTPSAVDKAKGTINLYVTATGTGACAPPTDSIRLSVQQDPVVNAGPDQTVCITTPTVALNGNVTNASGGTWTSLGGGTFSPAATNLNALYTKSNADTTNKKATLILTSIPNGYCPSVKDTMVITLTPLPLVNAGPNQTTCADSSGVSLNSTIKVATGATWTSSGSGNFTPNANTLNATYKPSPADTAARSVQLILTTTGNGACIAAKDTVIVTITPAPTINVGPDQIICADVKTINLNGATTVASGIKWTTTGSGSFNITTPHSSQYTISSGDSASAPGTVKFTGTTTGNGSCKAVTDNLVLTITPVPTITASAPPACADMNSIQLSGSVSVATGVIWTTSGTGTFTPNNTTLNANFVPSAADKAAGTVNLLLTSTGNGTCIPVSAPVVLTIAPAPIVNSGTDTTVCANIGSVSLLGSVLNAGGGTWSSSGSGSFTPNNTALNGAYNLSNADTTAHTITLVLTSTGNGVCKAVTDSKVITITPSPVVNAGADQLVCGDASKITLNGNVSNAGGGTWTTSGTGTFSNVNSLIPTYQFSAADTTAGTVTLTLTSTGNGLCKAASDQLVVVITDAPKVSAGIDQTVCADTSRVSLSGTFTVSSGITWTSSGSGKFTPNANSLNATYIPSAADITAQGVQLNLTTTGNGLCKSVKDSMIVNITPAPTINVGPDQTVCADIKTISLNGTTTVATGITWTTTGSGSFINGTALSTQYTLSSGDSTSGKVTFTGTTIGNGTCKAVSDRLVLTITPVPTITASAPPACADMNSIQLSGSISVATGVLWTTSGTGTFEPNNTTSNANYIPSAADKAAGTVNLLLTSTGNGTCIPVSAPVVLTIAPAPIVNAGTDTTVCADIGSVILSGSVVNAGGGIWSSSGSGSFTPASSSLNGSYNLSNADTTAHTITLVLTSIGNGVCKAVTDSKVITITPSPIVNAGADQLVCGDANTIKLNGNVSNAGGGTWTTSGTSTFSNANSLNPTYQFSAADTTAGTVTLTLTSTGNGLCKAASDQLVVVITDAPQVSAGPDQIICADSSGVSLSGTFTVSSGITWTSTGSGKFTPNTNTLNATYVPSAADIAANGVQLTLTTTGNGTCNSVNDAITVTITPAPTINTGTDQTVCADVNAITLNGTTTVASGIKWTTTGTGSFTSINPLSSQYTLSNGDSALALGKIKFIGTTTGNGTCKAVKDSLILTITPVPTITASAPPACADMNSIQLSGSVSVATGVKWTTSGTGTFSPDDVTLNAKYLPSAADKGAGTVNLLLTSTGNGTCNPVSAPVTLIIAPAPIVNAGADTTVCADAVTVNLSGSVVNAGGGTWSSSGSGSFAPSSNNLNTTYNLSNADTTAHTITLVLTSTGNGVCKAVTDSKVITLTPSPVVNAGADQLVCGDASFIKLNGSISNAGGGTWTSSGTGTFTNTNSLNPSYQFSSADTTAGTVTLTLTSTGNGLCKAASDQLVVVITDAPHVSAGASQTICADAGGVSLSGTFTVSSGITWTSSGTGKFNPNANTLNATYVPSVSDIAAQSVLLTLATTGNGSCNSVKDSITVTITPAPTINVGPDQTVCADVKTISLSGTTTVATGITWTTTASGSFNNATALSSQYTISSGDSTSGTVKFIGTTIGNGTCKAVSDTLVLTITPVPIIIASAAPACADMNSIQLSGSISVATGVIWTTSGTGTFAPNNTTLNAKYVPSAADKAAGTVNLLLTSTGNGTCNPISAPVTINIAPAPVANAGPDYTVCADIGMVSLSGSVTNAGGGSWSTLGTGNFTPSNISLNTTYNLSNADTSAHSVKLVLTTTGNGLCNAVTDTMVINIIPAPVVDAGADKLVCGDADMINVNGTVFNTTGGTWTSSGTGIFSNANSLNPTYQFSAADTTAGTVTLTLTSTGNGTCKAASDQLVVAITDAPKVSAGASQTICADASGVSLSGNFTVSSGITWTSTGSGKFTPNANSLNATYIPSVADIAAQSVQLNLTTTGNGLCKSEKDSMIVSITPAPTINVGSDQTVCADANSINLNATTSVATGINWASTGTGSFSSATSLATQYTLSSADTTAGLIKFIGTTTGNGTCKAVSDTLILTITPAPTIIASATTACAQSDTIQLSGIVTVATGVKWTTSGTGTFVPSDAVLNSKYLPSAADKASGSAILLLTSTGNGTCKPVSATATLNVMPSPIANAGTDKTVCADIGTIGLSGSVTNASGGTWSTLGTGTFAPSATNLNATYNLSNADTTAHKVTLVLTTTGNGLCNAVTDTLVINILPAPVVNAGFDQPVCGDASSIQVNGTVVNAGSGTWTSSGTGTFSNANSLNPTYQFTPADTTAGTVTLTLSSTVNGTCKPVSDQVVITITDAPKVNAGPDQTICADASGISLTGSVTVASGVVWTSSGSGTFSPNSNALNAIYLPSASDIAAQSVQLTLTTIGAGTCKPVSDQMTITITPAPTINVGPDQTVCADATTINLNATITVATGVNWTTTGTGKFSSAISYPAQYTITNADTTSGTVKFIGTTTGNGTCKAVTDTLLLSFSSVPTITASAGNACADSDTIQLSGSVTVATGALWTTSGTGTFVPNNTTLNAKYVASPADKAAGTVNLLLSSTGNGTCKPVSASVALNIIPAPIANAGADKTVCADNSVSLSGSVTNAGGGIWSTLGTGTFAPTATNLNAIYNLSNADTTAHTVTLVLTTTGNGLCNAVTDTMKITILPSPVVNAGFDQPVCGDAGSSQVNGIVFNAGGGTWTSSGTGTFNNANSLNPTYQFTAADTTAGAVTLTLMSIGNGTCKPVSDQVIITITDAPQVNAGPDQTLCADASGVSLNGSVTVASGVLWTSNGSGNFNPNANTLNAIYVPSAADTAAHSVQLTITTIGTGNCKPVSDQMTIIFTPAPTINVGPDAYICGDATTFNLNAHTTVASGIIWISTGAGSFGNATTLSTQYSLFTSDKTSGLVKFIGTTTGNGTCSAVSDTLSLNITTAPTVNAGPDITICSDSTMLQISGSTTVASGIVWTTNGSGTFVPNANTLTAFYKPSGADISNGGVDIKITTTGNGTCLPVSDSLRITLTPAPTVNAGPDQTVCANSSGVSLNGAVTVATGGVWTSSGSGTFSPDANGITRTYIPSSADTSAKSVTLILSTTGNGTCKARKDTIVLSIDPLPIVHSGANSSCADKNGVLLNGTVANAAGGLWTTSGSGTFTPNVTNLNSRYIPSAGDIKGEVVKLTLTSVGNGTCNADSSSFDLVTVFKKPIADAGPDQRICIHSMATLNGTQIPNASYTWSTENNLPIGKSTSLNVIADSDTSFVFAVTDTSGCVVTDTMNVFVVDSVKFQLDPHYCFEPGLILDANPQPTIPTVGTFNWYRNDTILVGENNSTLQVQKIGKHLINYSYGTCTYADSTVVTPLPNPKGADKYTCPGSSTLISTSPVGVNYQWNINNKLIVQDSNSINVNASHTPGVSQAYVVTVTDKLGCKNNDTINVIAIPPPDLILNDASACIGSTVTLTARVSNISSLQYGLQPQYVWEKDYQYMPDTLASITVTKAGIYSVRLNIGECYAYDTATVTYHNYPIPSNESNYTFCFDDGGGTLDAGPGYAYNWLNVPAGVPNTNRTVSVNAPGVYYVMISNEFNCSVKDSMFVDEKCAPQLYVAASFTPGVPGGNSKFFVKGIHFANYEIFIYNRWGEMIFHTTNPDESWDGTFRGEDMPPDVYPYVITYTGDNDSYTKKYQKQGSVTLIR